jgi:hypothetical protein
MHRDGGKKSSAAGHRLPSAWPYEGQLTLGLQMFGFRRPRAEG